LIGYAADCLVARIGVVRVVALGKLGVSSLNNRRIGKLLGCGQTRLRASIMPGDVDQ
jgi:hypothetical protein